MLPALIVIALAAVAVGLLLHQQRRSGEGSKPANRKPETESRPSNAGQTQPVEGHDQTRPQLPERPIRQSDDPTADPRDRDAYFRSILARDMDRRPEETLELLYSAASFYLRQHPEYADEQVLNEIMRQHRKSPAGDYLAHEVETEMYLKGSGVPADNDKAFAAARNGAAAGSAYSAEVAGSLLLTGKVKPFNKDLARDYLFAAFRWDSLPSLGAQLARVYTGIHGTTPDWPVAAAILKYAVHSANDRADMTGPDEATLQQLAEITARLNPEEIQLSDTYFDLLAEYGDMPGDPELKGIPHLEDVRALQPE